MLPDLLFNGYAEAVMDWWLIGRTESDLADLAESAAPGWDYSVFVEPNRNVGFLTLDRSAGGIGPP